MRWSGPLAMMLSMALTAAGAAEGWTWPVEGPARVIRAFSLPPQPWQPGHRGIDIAAPSSELLAPADGVVRYAGWVVDRGVLSIDHGGGVVSSYEPVEPTVAAGDAVARGQVVARIVPGHCAAPCVHVGLRVDDEYGNPLRWLGGGEWPVLLPTRRIRRAGGRADSPRGASRR